MSIILQTKNLSIGYNQKVVLKNINIELKQGDFVCIVGANGIGKSTLLKTLSGLLSKISGDIYIDTKTIESYKSDELYKNISVVLTDFINKSFLNVYDIVTTGRYSYSGLLSKMSLKDKEIIRHSIELVNLKGYENHFFSELSDGLKQRTMIAKAFAQSTPIVMLDEPTAHLDLINKYNIFLLLKNLAETSGKSIIVSTHELELASQVADKILIVGNNKSIISGTTEDLMIADAFKSCFETDKIKYNSETGRFSFIPENKGLKVNLIGEGRRYFWTKKALIRKGYTISDISDISITCNKTDWSFQKKNFKKTLSNIEQLLDELVLKK